MQSEGVSAKQRGRNWPRQARPGNIGTDAAVVMLFKSESWGTWRITGPRCSGADGRPSIKVPHSKSRHSTSMPEPKRERRRSICDGPQPTRGDHLMRRATRATTRRGPGA